MRQNEWMELVQLMQAMWPQAKFPPKAMQVQYEFVKGTSYEAGMAAVKTLATDDWPPNSAKIAKVAMELESGDEPDFDQVRAVFRQMLKGSHWHMHKAPRYEDWRERGVHERIALFFDADRWRLWCSMPEDDTTFYAQQREEYRAAKARAESELRLMAAGVERKALEVRRGPHRLDEGLLRALGPGPGMER